MTEMHHGNLTRIGWREWVGFDALGLPPIKAKIDTGARTSAIHAFQVRAFRRKGKRWVRFSVHPHQREVHGAVECEARVVDRRPVTDSGGHTQKRWVIHSTVRLGDQIWPIELTLTNRDTMRFRVLLGRTALRGRYLVDSAHSFLTGGNKDAPPGTLEPPRPER